MSQILICDKCDLKDSWEGLLSCGIMTFTRLLLFQVRMFLRLSIRRTWPRGSCWGRALLLMLRSPCCSSSSKVSVGLVPNMLSMLLAPQPWCSVKSALLYCTECGPNFTSKLEGMFKDMELSREMMVNYREVCNHIDQITVPPHSHKQ